MLPALRRDTVRDITIELLLRSHELPEMHVVESVNVDLDIATTILDRLAH